MIQQAIDDLAGVRHPPTDARASALAWISGAPSKLPFERCCALVGLEAEAVREALRVFLPSLSSLGSSATIEGNGAIQLRPGRNGDRVVGAALYSPLCEQVADVELQRWILTNPDRANLAPEVVAPIRERETVNALQRLSAIRRRTAISLAWVLSAAVVAIAAASGLGASLGSSRAASFAVASAFAFSWGTLGRLGWAEGSYSSDTAVERIDRAMLWGLYWIGTVLATLAAIVSLR